MRPETSLAGAALAASLILASTADAVDKATTVLNDGSGKKVGKVRLTATPSGILIQLYLTGIPPGEHAFHVHEVGKCEPPDFKSAGAHFSPDKTKHGLMNPEGPHAGDMPNLHVPDSGKLSIEILNPLVTLRGERALLDEDGSALVIHAGADDYTTDPTGNAGNRIACGVITE